jgi:DNA-binding CsgD family transcriptional regulator
MKANISNMVELAREMSARGKTEDEIAGILDIDVRQVHAFLERTPK